MYSLSVMLGVGVLGLVCTLLLLVLVYAEGVALTAVVERINELESVGEQERSIPFAASLLWILVLVSAPVTTGGVLYLWFFQPWALSGVPAQLRTGIFAGVGGLRLCAPLAIHQDRRRLADIEGWTPSRLYYAVVIALVGDVLALVYLLKRGRIERQSSTEDQFGQRT
jgi:hypothetical protein